MTQQSPRRRITLALTLFAGGLALIPFLPVQPPPISPVTPATPSPTVCTGDVVVARWGEPVGCDVVPPQRLDIVLPDTSDAVGECRDMSGTPIPMGGRLYCRDVDY